MPEQETSKAVSSEKRGKGGESRGVKATKMFFRPIIKFFYYVFRFVGSHKSLSVLLLLLFIASIVGTNSYLTNTTPFGIGEDQWRFKVNGKNVGGERVRAWIYALRAGDLSSLSLYQSGLSVESGQAPDPQKMITAYSQTRERIWTSINVINVSQRADTTLDSFIEINLKVVGPGASQNAVMVLHFVTVSDGTSERFMGISLIDVRPLYT